MLSASRSRFAPPEGLIVQIARQAGVELRGAGPKFPCRCPLHEDNHASAFIHATHNIFHCAVCTPGSSLTAKQFAEGTGVPWPYGPGSIGTGQPRARPAAPQRRSVETPIGALPGFGPAEAQLVWDACLARARDDAVAQDDAPAYEYLASRGLADAWEEQAFGIAPPDPSLPGGTESWRSRGYHIVVPLLDAAGATAGVQARSIRPGAKIKTVFPTGCRAKGLVFANRQGQRLLQGGRPCTGTALLGEGLTDALAFSITAPGPALCSPGTGLAATSIGAWVAGQHLLVAMDADAAGQGVIDAIARAAYAHGAEAVSQLAWPDGITDACDMLADQGPNALAGFLDTAAKEARHG